jgi:glucokinase
MGEKYFVGVDIGGTRIKTVLSYGDNVLVSRSILTKSGLSSDKIITRIIKLIYSLFDSVEINISQLYGVGIGVPGIFEKSGKIINLPNLQILNGVNFKLILKNEFGNFVKVKIVNDAQLPYHFHKNILDEKNVAYLTVGTSLGCSLVLNGKLYVGAGLASQLSGSYFISKNKSMRVGDVLAIDHILKSCVKRGLVVSNFSDFKNKLKSKDKIALDVFRDYGNNLGFVFRNIFQILHLDKIYLSGGLTNFSNYFLDDAINNFKSNGKSMGDCPIEIIKTETGVEIGAVGASKLFEK